MTQSLSHHDPGHVAEKDLVDKGLNANSLSLFDSVMLAVANVAPALSISGTVGYVAAQVGVATPAALLIGFIPMILVAFAYRELNKVAPDCGTVFTWSTKSFNPYFGWMAGWAMVIAGIIVLAALAVWAAQYFLLFIADLTGSPRAIELSEDVWAYTSFGVVLTFLMSIIAIRGFSMSKSLQTGLVLTQLGVLGVFAGTALYKGLTGSLKVGSGFTASDETTIPFEATTPSLSWFNPLEMGSMTSAIGAILLVLFIYWGWDVALAANEETENSETAPAKAALLSVLILAATYVITAVACIAVAGPELMANEDFASDVVYNLAPAVVGETLAPFVTLTIGISSATALLTSLITPARSLLAMGIYRAVPAQFGQVHRKYHTPAAGTIVAGAGSSLYLVVVTVLSEDILNDIISSLGLMICVYFSACAFACVWWFRKELTTSAKNLWFKGILPMLGGIFLTYAFVASAIDMYAQDYGSTVIFGVGGVFVLGVGVLLAGIPLMLLQRLREPAFFRGETLAHDTPTLVIPEDASAADLAGAGIRQ